MIGSSKDRDPQPVVSQQEKHSSGARNVTPHDLMCAVLVVVTLFGTVAAERIYPDNRWVKTFLVGGRGLLFLVCALGGLYLIERFLQRTTWYAKSWFMKEIGRKGRRLE